MSDLPCPDCGAAIESEERSELATWLRWTCRRVENRWHWIGEADEVSIVRCQAGAVSAEVDRTMRVYHRATVAMSAEVACG